MDIPVRPQTTKSSRKFNLTSGAKNKVWIKLYFSILNNKKLVLSPGILYKRII